MTKPKTKNEELADQYPIIYKESKTPKLGDLVRNFVDILVLHNDVDRAVEFLDRQFLFGVWGFAIREIREYQFVKDIRGFIVATAREGLRRSRWGSVAKPEARPLEWCWREKQSKLAYGPISTRDAAIKNATDLSDSKSVMIGNCIYPDPAQVASDTIDLDYLLEQMDEYTYDNEYPFEDPVFDMKSSRAKEAQEALSRVMGDWAREYIDPPSCWHSGSEEEVVIKRKES